MKRLLISFFLFIGAILATANGAGAEGLEPAMQAKVDAQTKQIQSWAADPVVIKAVKAHNAGLPAELTAMTQEKWKSLSILDPVVRAFNKNEAGQYLKGRKTEVVAEAFLSGAEGMKVAFLSKPSSWSHKGKPKHDQPMAGKVWQGPIEADESTGLQQVQVAVPVLEAGKPIGSLVVGLSLSKLAKL